MTERLTRMTNDPQTRQQVTAQTGDLLDRGYH